MDFIKRWVIFHWNHLIKKIICFAYKLIKNIPHPYNTKAHSQSFIIKKKGKSVKQSYEITYQPETFDTVDIESFITEHAKTSYNLSKTIRQAKNVGSNSSLYSDRTKVNFVWAKKNFKRTKRWI